MSKNIDNGFITGEGKTDVSLVFAQEQALEDLAAWSQILANMRSNFRAILGEEYQEVGSFRYPLQPLLRVRAAVFRKLLKRPFLSDRSVGRWRYFSRTVQERLPAQSNWALMAGTSFLSFWPDGSPVLRAFWTDATFHQFINYWPSHQGLAASFRAMGDDLERRALNNADLCAYSSKWAADSAIKDYGINPDKILVAPFGANMPAAMLEAAERTWSAPKPELRILSVGVDWFRKGMDIAIGVVSALRERGVDVSLDIVGVYPPPGENLPPFVRLHGRLDKIDPQQQAKLTRLYQEASAFILFSRADASPIVFSEAAAFGLPRLSSDTGGVRSLINDGVDGCLFAPQSGIAEIAAQLEPIFNHHDRLMQMRQKARHGYETQWNWPTQCRRILERMRAIQESRRRK